MSRIDKLIAEFCPNGVEFKTIESLVLKPSNIRWADNTNAEFKYIDLTSVDRLTHAIVETATISSENAPSRAQQLVQEGDVIFGTTRPMLKRYAVIPHEYDGQICSTGFCIFRPDTDKVLSNFLFHLLGTNDFYNYVEANERGASYPAIPDNVVKKYRVPVPPLQLQREIAKVLDTFSKVEAELETKLESELEARLQQYGYYRDKLMTSDEGAINGKDGWTTLSEVGTFTRGRRFTNNDFVESGIGCIHYGEIYTHYGPYASETKSFVRPELAATLRMAKKGNLVIAGTGESVEDIGKAVAWLGNEEVAVHDDCYIFSHSLNPKYLSYFFQSSHFNAQKVKYAAGAKMIRISSDGLGKIRIYVPPIKEQEQVVSVLDSFDVLVNDLSCNLPAEIQARRQQYEYYRNRLLTFREAL